MTPCLGTLGVRESTSSCSASASKRTYLRVIEHVVAVTNSRDARALGSDGSGNTGDGVPAVCACAFVAAAVSMLIEPIDAQKAGVEGEW